MNIVPINAISDQIAIANGLIRMVRQRDPALSDHLESVGLLSERLGRTIGLTSSTIANLALAARLHDIGKQSIALGILHKPAGLSPEEWREIETHPNNGYLIVAGFPQIAHVAHIVRAHHERVDGRGYPDGVLEPDIPLESRIIAITDAFHAMTTRRPYTNVKSPAAALAEIQAAAGTQFDPHLVDAFRSMLAHRIRLNLSA